MNGSFLSQNNQNLCINFDLVNFPFWYFEEQTKKLSYYMCFSDFGFDFVLFSFFGELESMRWLFWPKKCNICSLRLFLVLTSFRPHEVFSRRACTAKQTDPLQLAKRQTSKTTITQEWRAPALPSRCHGSPQIASAQIQGHLLPLTPYPTWPGKSLVYPASFVEFTQFNRQVSWYFFTIVHWMDILDTEFLSLTE